MENFITGKIRMESLEKLKELIEIPSVNKRPDETSIPPFGPDIDRALTKALELCKDLGMKTYKDPEGFYGYADYGEGEKMMGVLCHLDVVPVNKLEKWETEPFTLTEKEGYLYGRGVQDDKGPAVSSLYAFKAVVDQYPDFNHKIRFIFGLDEEQYWRGITKYNENEEIPDFGFVPDSKFPLAGVEKHLLRARLIGPGSPQIQMDNGGVFNTIPSTASYTGANINILEKALSRLNISYGVEDDTLTVYGQSTNSHSAQKGTNAIVLLAKGLMSIVPHPTVGFIGEKVGVEANGKNLFGHVRDAESGDLSFNIAGLKIEKDHSVVLLDMRIPLKVDKDEYVEELKKQVEPFGLEYVEVSYLKPLDSSKRTETGDVLLNVYRDKTGDYSEPLPTGEATYARFLNKLVPFGPLFPDGEDSSHSANERVRLEEGFYRSMDIYAEAIYRLCVQEN